MNTNDQRITAYALGELRGAERDAFEADLAASEDLQREFKETLEMIEKIGNLPAPTEALSDEQRAALRDECQRNTKIVRHRFRVRRMVIVGTLGTMAACLVIGIMVLRVDRPPAMFLSQKEASFKGTSSVDADKMGDQGMVVNAQLENAKSMAKDSKPGPASLNQPTLAVMKAAPEPTPLELAAQLNESKSIAQQPAVSTATAPTYADSLVRREEPMPMASTMTAHLAKTGDVQARSLMPQSAAAVGGAFRSKSVLVADEEAPSDLRRDGALYKSRGTDVRAETYAAITENTFLTSKENPLSTFSIDVDTASYANVRRFLQSEERPPLDAVRIEELVNYFPYSYAQPEGKVPFSVKVEVAQAPWDKEHQLARIALKGKEVQVADLPPSNLVFLVDVSGSMNEPNKLPLLKRSLAALVERLRPQDRVAIVVYAGNSGLVLPSTAGKDKERILQALDNLEAGGSTNGGAGIKLAYEIAKENFVKDGCNRVILCTDGDFNVGTTSEGALVKLMEDERKSGVFLSVLGFGTENLKDSTMEKLADKGNGNYSYIDSFSEGRKVLVEQMGGTLFTIAKDVKIQVEFNPAKVAGYRLIGYEKRLLAKEDFNDDKKDAGEIGSGHTVTALYEIVPAGQALPDQPSVDALKYQTPKASAVEESPMSAKASDELFTVKLRYKTPDGDKSQLIEVPVASGADQAFDQGSEDFQFAAAVAAFGMKLRDSKYVGDISWRDIQKIARRSLGADTGSYRAEFLTLVEKASKLKAFQPKTDQGE